ncbi:MAG: DUF2277 domain-containing protein [Dehalococcoidia bacterium]
MCRSIKVLRVAEGQPTEADIQAAALQFVRKISGYRQPSRANALAFETAVAEIAAVSQKLLASLQNRPSSAKEATTAPV